MEIASKKEHKEYFNQLLDRVVERCRKSGSLGDGLKLKENQPRLEIPESFAVVSSGIAFPEKLKNRYIISMLREQPSEATKRMLESIAGECKQKEIHMKSYAVWGDKEEDKVDKFMEELEDKGEKVIVLGFGAG